MKGRVYLAQPGVELTTCSVADRRAGHHATGLPTFRKLKYIIIKVSSVILIFVVNVIEVFIICAALF